MGKSPLAVTGQIEKNHREEGAGAQRTAQDKYDTKTSFQV